MAWLQPPITGDNLLDSWTLRITQQINQGLTPGVGGAGGGGGGASEDFEVGNTAIYLYQRTESDSIVPVRPTSVSYNIADLESVNITANEGWSGTIPEESAGPYLWITFRYIADTMNTITNANSWDTPRLLSIPGDNAVFVRINSFSLPAGMTLAEVITAYDAQTAGVVGGFPVNPEGFQFRDNGGNQKVLVATVQIGGADASETLHYTYNYSWSRNGLTFVPTITGQNLTRRFIVINATDAADGGEDSFLCTVSEPN